MTSMWRVVVVSLAWVIANEAHAANECVQEGERFSAKSPGMMCCPGLKRIETDRPAKDRNARLPDYPKGCEPEGPPDSKICTACGDGRCGPGENRCNCAVDCR